MSRLVTMTIGQLTGFIDLQDKGFASGLDQAGRGLDRLQSTTSSKTASIESTVSKSFVEVERAISEGLDPTDALADLDQLERALEQAFGEMVADANKFGAELEREIDTAFDALDDDAAQAGKRAADELVDGLRDGLRDAERVARGAGDDSGRRFGDGVEQSGGGGGGGGRMGKIGVSLVGGLKAGALGVALAAGAAIGAALMTGLEKSLDFEKAKAKLAAQLGTLGADSQRIGKVAGSVFADAYGDSMSDVTDAIKSVVQNMDGMRDASDAALGDMTKRAMDVGEILGEDVNAVTRAVSQILRNELAPNAEAAFDLIVKGAQDGVNKSEDLLDTFNEYSTQFRELGLTGKQALGLLSQGLQAGARDADTVADALKEFAIRAQDGSDTSRAAFEDIGFNADKMFEVFASGGPTAALNLGEVLKRIREIEDPVKRSEVAVALFGTKAEDLQDALYALDPTTAVDAIGQVEGAAKAAGDTLHNTAADRITAFKRTVEENLVNFLDTRVLPALDEWAGWFQTGPMGDALAGLKSDFSGLFDEITSSISEWASSNEDTLGDIKGVYEETFGALTSLISEWVTTATEFWDEWGDTIMSIVSVVVQGVLANIGGWLTTLKGIFQTIKAVLTGDWEAAWEGIKTIAEGATRGIRTLIESALRELLKSMGLNWDEMKSQAKQKLEDLVANVRNLPSTLKSIAAEAKTWLLQAGRDLIMGMINGVKQKAADLANAARNTVANAVNAVRNALDMRSPSKVFELLGIQTIEGYILGVNGKSGAVTAAIQQMVQKALAAARAAVSGAAGGASAGSVIPPPPPKDPNAGGLVAGHYGTGISSPLVDGTGSAGQPAVNVTIQEATIREEADFERLGAAVSFAVMGRGLV